MQGINRIRLEFKARTADKISRINFVLIESDWNLKFTLSANSSTSTKGINRIRLEFKVHRLLEALF